MVETKLLANAGDRTTRLDSRNQKRTEAVELREPFTNRSIQRHVRRMTWRDRPLPPVDNRARFVFGHAALQVIVADAMAAKSPELVFAPADVTFTVLGNGMIQTTAIGLSGLRPRREGDRDG